MSSEDDHYLKKELYALIRRDSSIFEFLQQYSLDGLWYWDLETPENEWLSPEFWELLGYDPAEKKHLASEWQNLIHPEDLKDALRNVEAHCKDPSHLYDQVVRYRHKDGSTVWVRCRGVAIRNRSGSPVRLLGAHNDLTQLKAAEDVLRQGHVQLEQRVKERTAELAETNERLRADIIERKQAEEALASERERFKDFAEVAADYFWEMSPGLRFNYVSEGFEEITGLLPSELLGQTHQEFWAAQASISVPSTEK